MSISKDILETEVRLTSNQAMAELKKLEGTTASLRRENERLKTIKAQMEVAGKQETEEYKKLNTQIKANNKTIRENEGRLSSLRKIVGVTGMSMSDLRNRARELQRQLDSTVKAANPEEYARLEKELGQVRTQMSNLGTRSAHTNKILSAFKTILPALGVAAVVSGLKNLARQMIEVRKEFEKYEAVLSNSLGSVQAARMELNMLQKFAAETPFSLQQLTGAYVKLINQGFKPTEEQMRKLGDIAASTGKDMDQLAEAIIDAMVGENERLKEFGIRGEKHGDKITYTFKGIKTEVDFTAEAIQEYILSLGELEGVSGSMAKISETLGGRISNLGDAWDNLLNTLGSRTSGVFIGVINWLIKFVDNLSMASKSIEQIKQTAMDNTTRENLKKGIKEIETMANSLVKNGIDREKAQERALALYNESINNQIRQMIGRYSSATDAQKKNYDTRIELLTQEQDAVNEHYKKMAEIESKNTSVKGVDLTAHLEKAYDERIMMVKKKLAEEKITKELYDRELILEEIAYLEAAIALKQQHGEATIDLQSKLYDRMSELNRQYQAGAEELEKSAQATLDEMQQVEGENYEKFLEEQMRRLMSFYNKKWEIEQKDRDMQKEELEKLKAIWDKRIDMAHDYGSELGDMLGQAAADGELTLEKFGKSLLIMALKVLRDQAHIAIGKITVEALASPDSVATAGVSGIIKAALLSALVETAYQGVKGAIMKGYDTGGYTPDGLWNQPQGVVHSNEWVGNRYAVANPNVRQFLDVFDLAQRSGQIQSLNTDAILRAVELKRGGFASGGYSSPQTPVTVNPKVVVTSDPEMKELLRMLLIKGVKGHVSFHEFEDAQTEVSAIRSKSTIQ